MRVSGTIVPGEIGTAIADFTKENMTNFAPVKYWVSDFSGMDSLNSDPAEVTKLAEFCVELSETNPNLVVAICAPQQITFGLARMWEMLADRTGWVVHVASDMKQLNKWLKDRVGSTIPSA